MEFIDRLHLKSKLLYLFLIISLGLLFVSGIGFISINSMKKNLDNLYFGSLIPVVELQSIQENYQKEMQNTLYRVRDNQITAQEAILKIEQALSNIDKTWDTYKHHYKRDEELSYIAYTSDEIAKTKAYFEQVISLCNHRDTRPPLEFKRLEDKISTIHLIISKLIKYEIDYAHYERQKLLITYDNTLMQIGLIIVIIMIAVLSITLAIFKSIQKQQLKLEITSQKLSQANKKLEEASYTDALTQLYNRRYFNLIFERELKRAKRTKSVITFMMIDVDYFKQYNDTYGHIKGDEALKSLAHVFKETLQRPGDFVFRLGGEEFGVLITDTDALQSQGLAQKLVQNVQALCIAHQTSSVSECVSISIGAISTVPKIDLSEQHIMHSADEKLYEAKTAGRNRAVWVEYS